MVKGCGVGTVGTARFYACNAACLPHQPWQKRVPVARTAAASHCGSCGCTGWRGGCRRCGCTGWRGCRRCCGRGWRAKRCRGWRWRKAVRGDAFVGANVNRARLCVPALILAAVACAGAVAAGIDGRAAGVERMCARAPAVLRKRPDVGRCVDQVAACAEQAATIIAEVVTTAVHVLVLVALIQPAIGRDIAGK